MSDLAVTVDGDGPAVVLIHGLASSSVLWGSTVAGLRERHKVVTIDLPGFGASAPLDKGFELDAVAQAVAAAAAQAIRPKRRYVLVGHSLGGAVATLVAAHDPQRVKQLILAAPAGYQRMNATAVRAVAGVNERLVHVRRRIGPRFVGRARVRAIMFAPSVHNAGALSADDARLLLSASTGARRVAAAMTAISDLDLRPVLRDVAAPVGLIWGHHDRLVSPHGVEGVHTVRPEARVEWIEAAGHVPMLEQPGAWLAALERLLR